MGSEGSKHETRYTYVDNTERDRRAAREREERRLENERKQNEYQEQLRIKKEQEEEEKRRKKQYQEQRQREQAQEEEKIRKEAARLLELENELCLRRAELYNYTFGSKTHLDSFRGLAIDDVTKLRIGVFGPTGSGKSCFINTCERAVRKEEKGTVPDNTAGSEGTIILQDYLPEMFFRLVDTRGFFNYNSNENEEFENILEGRLRPGDNVFRSVPGSKENTASKNNLHSNSEFSDKLHGVIIVVKANDKRLTEGTLKDYLNPVRQILRRQGIAPMTVVTHHDTLKTKEEEDNAKYEASAATGSSPGHVFFMANYTKENSTRDPDIERMTFDILHFALLSAERAVKIMKQKLKNEEEDRMMRALDGVSVKEQVAPDSADASVEVFLRFLQKEYQWSSNSVREAVSKLSRDDVTTVKLLAMCWKDVRNYFVVGMRAMIEKELKNRGLIS
ncbi:inner centromere protein A-like [Montipora capricornis]|uniref:inner centromere protein A-like n=1 Tax=Montipora capricornis TaxID=246305 RepID=UPI0035F1CA77